MFTMKIILYIVCLQIFESNSVFVTLLPKVSQFKNVTSFADIQPVREDLSSISRKRGSDRSSRFLGNLSFVLGVGNSGSNANSSALNIPHTYSPFIAAIYEPFPINIRSLLPFKWFFTMTPKNSTIAGNSLNNTTFNKEDNIEYDAEILPDHESMFQGWQNDGLFFHHELNTTEKIETESPGINTRPTGPASPLPFPTVRPTTAPPLTTPELISTTSTKKPKSTTARPEETTPPFPPEIPEELTEEPNVTPSTTTPPSSTTVTHNPVTPLVPHTLTPITSKPTTHNPTTKMPQTHTTTTELPTTEMVQNTTVSNGSMIDATEFPGYYGGNPQNIHHVELTTELNYNDYNDIRDKFVDGQNEYDAINFENNNYETFEPSPILNNPGMQFFYDPTKIHLDDGFRPNGNSQRLWYFDHRREQFG